MVSFEMSQLEFATKMHEKLIDIEKDLVELIQNNPSKTDFYFEQLKFARSEAEHMRKDMDKNKERLNHLQEVFKK